MSALRTQPSRTSTGTLRSIRILVTIHTRAQESDIVGKLLASRLLVEPGVFRRPLRLLDDHHSVVANVWLLGSQPIGNNQRGEDGVLFESHLLEFPDLG